MRKIVIVTSEFPPQPGGIGNHAYHLAMQLSNNSYQVHVIADQRSKDNEQEKVFDEALPFSVERIKLQDWRLLMYFRRITATFSSLRHADNVIATGKFSLWNVGFCNLFFKCHTLAVVHGSEVNFKSVVLRKSIDKALKQFDAIIAVSGYTKSLMSHINRDIVVIPNGINFSEWNEKKDSSIELKGYPALTTVGRVSIRKGQLQVIKQLPELIKSFPELHYHCVGIPTEVDAFIKKAKELNVLSHITFYGSVDVHTLKQVLIETDIFVMLSTESETGDVEGFGIAILEANALGIPAIGAKGCGIEDAIKPNVSGILIDSKNTNEFKAGIDAILEAKVTFKEGASSWAKSHDWTHITKHYIAMLK